MTELGSYPLYAIFKLLGSDYKDVRFVSCMKNGVDIFTKIDFVYEGAVASAKVGLGVKTEGDLVISGTRGYVYVPAPWWKTEYFEMRFENSGDTEKYFYKFAGEGLRYEMVEFLERIGGVVMQDCDENVSVTAVIEKYLSEMDNMIIH